jgi:hypothetical protein
MTDAKATASSSDRSDDAQEVNISSPWHLPLAFTSDSLDDLVQAE